MQLHKMCNNVLVVLSLQCRISTYYIFKGDGRGMKQMKSGQLMTLVLNVSEHLTLLLA